MNVNDFSLKCSIGLHLSREELPGISYIDIGRKLSIAISDLLIDSKLSLKAKSELSAILGFELEKNRKLNQNYIALKNIGILHEESLKIDFLHFIKQYSDDCTLVLKHEGEIIGNNFYFNTKNGVVVNLKNITYSSYEI